MRERLIFALDGMDEKSALEHVSLLKSEVGIFKIGPGLVYRAGLAIAGRIARLGGEEKVRVFLDMKTLDIPATVAGALETTERFGEKPVVFTTIHIFNAGLRLMEGREKRELKVFAVSLLTSLDQQDLREIGSSLSVRDFVLFQAKRAHEMGCDGIIASGREAGMIREEFGGELLIITPGIRPEWTAIANDDQKRTTTPREAILSGADHIVVGRPIRDYPGGPLEAAKKIQAEIQQAVGDVEAE